MNFTLKAIVEIPLGSVYKYEVDKESGKLVVDRLLPSPIAYNYGYIPGTLYKDGDPLDICIIGDYPIAPLSMVKVVIVGAFLCNDNGASDDKLIGYVEGDPSFVFQEGDSYFDQTIKAEQSWVQLYLSTYKKGFEVLGYVGSTDALALVKEGQAMYESQI